MNKEKTYKLYNILLPLWLLLFWPSYLWLILIPANYLIDRLVLRWGLGDLPDRGRFCRKHTWKICVAGFVSDLAGACFIFVVYLASSLISDNAPDGSILEQLAYGVGFNPLANVWAFLAVTLAVAIAGVLIFRLDRRILRRAGLEDAAARGAALKLALITAPYLYFFPSELLYRGGI